MRDYRLPVLIMGRTVTPGFYSLGDVRERAGVQKDRHGPDGLPRPRTTGSRAVRLSTDQDRRARRLGHADQPSFIYDYLKGLTRVGRRPTRLRLIRALRGRARRSRVYYPMHIHRIVDA